MAKHVLSLSACLVITISARAQIVPVGVHQGGRAGGAESPTSGGGALPLTLPPERDGLPVPFAFARGGATVQEAGLGWGLPLWSISASQNVSRHRPDYVDDAPGTWNSPSVSARVTLSMGGAPIRLVDYDGNGQWRAIVDHQTYRVTENASQDYWEMTDGEGRRYHFAHPPGTGPGWPWLLTYIVGSKRAQSRVDLGYVVSSVMIGGVNVPELVLDHVSYNSSPSGGCSKNTIALQYQTIVDPITQTARVLSTTVENGLFRARTKVVNSVALRAYGAGCNTTPISLRTWQLNYGADPDSGLPLLQSVDMTGRDGTDEQFISRPVARFAYGSVLAATGQQLGYTAMSSVSLPSDMSTASIGTLTSSNGGNSSNTTELLADFNGDGMADFARITGCPNGGPFCLALNAGGAALNDTPPPSLPPLIADTETSLPINRYGYSTTGVERTYTATIDVNGDGRPDFIDAHVLPHMWMVYVNEPSPSDPRQVVWQEVVWDMTNVQSDLNVRTQLVEQDYLPISRSQTAVHYKDTFCSDGTLCWRNVISQTSFVEWKLADLNGDGYPDLVANGAPIGVLPVSCSNGTQTVTCEHDTTYGSGHIMAYVNRGGPFASAASPPFAWPIYIHENDNEPVERWTQYFNGGTISITLDGVLTYFPGLPTRNKMIAGFVDVNGDGIVDRVTGSTVQLGSGWIDSSTAGTQYPLSLQLPAVGSTNAPPVARATFSARSATCVGAANQHIRYPVTTTTGILDVTGDGVPDYVNQADDGTWWVAIGTGLGFKGAIPIAAPAGFAISKSLEWCDDSGPAITVAGLFDVNGDGRLDYVVAGDGSGTTQTTSLTLYQLGGATGGAGALDAGRVIAQSNGYGATHHFSWGSAKSDTATPHVVPFPEIVVTKESITLDEGLGTAPAPTLRAYGDARLQYDGALDHWSWRGYNRTVTVSGIPVTTGDGAGKQVKGTATITDLMRPEDATSDYDRFVLVGRPRAVNVLAGTLSNQPASYLATTPESSGYWTSRQTRTWKTTSSRVPAAPYGVPDCTSMVNPFATLNIGGIGPGNRQDAACWVIGLGLDAMDVENVGTAAPPSDANVERATVVVDADALGRPHLVLHRNDTHRTDDDLCEERLYATPTNDFNVLSATRSVRYFVGSLPSGTGGIAPPGSLMNCNATVRTVYAERFAYDGLSEGSVGGGKPSQRFREVYDVNSGALLDSFAVTTLSYDGLGNMITEVDEAGSGHSVTTTFGYDAFGLAPTVMISSSTDVATKFERVITRDDFTNDPTDDQDDNGLHRQLKRDGFGRPTLATIIDPADKNIYLSEAFQYLGDTNVQPGGDQIDPLGRRVLERRWRDRAPLAAFNPVATAPGPNENWTTVFVDELGRRRRDVTNAGPDRPNQIVDGDTSLDALGRPEFVADPYVAGAGGTRYGTTYLYRPDSTVLCSVRGRGDLVGTMSAGTTDATQARYATCTDRVYGGNLARFRMWEPDQNLSSGTPQTYSERVMTAAGWRIEESKRSAGTALELMDLAYDPLGHVVNVTRYGTPASAAYPVVWTTSWDSFGHALTTSEPATATRNYGYDRVGNQTAVSWSDGSTTHWLNTEFDAFSRPTRSYEGTAAQPLNESDFTYDVAAPGGYQAAQPFLRGRMSSATDAQRKVYFSYDSLGNTAATTEIDSDGTRVDLGWHIRLDGEPSSITYKVPDDNFAIETASYGYDSGGTLTSVGWEDATGSSTLFSSVSLDAFGRYLTTKSGNNTTTVRGYNPTDRRELKTWTLTASDGEMLTSTFDAWDGEGRVVMRHDGSTALDNNDLTQLGYDALGRLHTAKITRAGGSIASSSTWSFDGLGNITDLVDSAVGAHWTYLPNANGDGDRLATLMLQPSGHPQTNLYYAYDPLGNVSSITGNGGVGYYNGGSQAPLPRYFTYDGRNRPAAVTNGNSLAAQWQYGPLGDIATFSTVNSPRGDNRFDQRFGLVEAKTTSGSGRVFLRHIPRSGATRRGWGAAAAIDYTVDNGRATRAVLNKDGAIAQEILYYPYGATRLDTMAPNVSGYQNFQFGGGDLLADFNLTRMGARLYDPITGRFLSRDPLMIPRSSLRAHPYAYAWNDPYNRSDPSGLDTTVSCTSDNCVQASASIAGTVTTWLGDMGIGVDSGADIPDLVASGRIDPPIPSMSLGDGLVGGLFPNPLSSSARYVAGEEAGALWDMGVDAGKGFAHDTKVFVTEGPVGLVSEKVRGAWHMVKNAPEIADAFIDNFRSIRGTTKNVVMIFAGFEGGEEVDAIELGLEDEVAEREAESFVEEEFGQCVENCFAAGTMVQTPDGPRAIETLERGDLVLSRDLDSGEVRAHAVLGVYVTPDHDVLRLTLQGHDGTDTLTVTPEHPFLGPAGWIDAGKLAPGDRVGDGKGEWLTVVAVASAPARHTVYNLEVAQEHTYLVGQLGAVVHNGPCCVSNLPDQLHHWLTNKNELYTPTFLSLLHDLGLELHEDWNLDFLPHRGPHPPAYHEWAIDRVMEATELAKGDVDAFLDHFDRLVKAPVLANPLMLRYEWWRQ